MKLHDKYADKGLVIIAVHDDSVASIEEMDQKLVSAKQRYWSGRDLPFLVALDGGGLTPIPGAADRKAKGATTAAYGIDSFPTRILIDKPGHVVADFDRGGKEGEKQIQIALGIYEDVSESFDELYRLEDGQIVRFIPPDEVVVRRKHMLDSDDADRFKAFYWSGGQLVTDTWRPFDRVTLSQLLSESPFGATRFDYEIGDPAAGEVELNGDWIVRRDASVSQRLAALAEILDRMRVPVRLEKRSAERQVIVARGRYTFQPLTGTYDNRSIHVFSDVLDPDERGGGGSGTVDRFLSQLGSVAFGMQVVNLAELPPNDIVQWRWHYSGYLRKVPEDERPQKLQQILQNVSRQTSLAFTTERRRVDVWHAIVP